MFINNVDSQKIVNRLMNLLGNNINIMNENGVIVASGDRTRINVVHDAAKLAIKERREVIVDEESIRKGKFKGTKTGVNIPIYFQNKIIGVVGITGDPLVVKQYGLIVKELVELMIQEEERKKYQLFHDRALRSFAKNLIKSSSIEERDMLLYRSQLVDFNVNINRIVIVADIVQMSSYIREYAEDSEVSMQMMKQQIVDIIQGLINLEKELVFNLNGHRYIIFKCCQEGENIGDFCSSIIKELNRKYVLKYNFGIGSLCTRIEDYSQSYLSATKAIDVGKKIDSGKNIFFSNDYRLQILLGSISSEQKINYLNEMKMNIDFSSADESTKDMILTVKAFFESGMNIQSTANKLFIHRNTVIYRINKFKETYKIDITDAYNCMTVYVAINLLQMKD